MYLFTEDNKTRDNVEKFRNVINKLTFSFETNIEPAANHTKYNNFTVQSIVDHLCLFGIKVNKEVPVTTSAQNRNCKKLQKLEDALKLLMDRVNAERYKKSSNQEMKVKHTEEVFNVKTYLKFYPVFMMCSLSFSISLFIYFR